MMWDEGISEGAHVGTTTHQGAPGGICAKNSKIFRKNRIKFLEHFENFCFWVIFYCMGNSENGQNIAFYFI